MVKEKGDVWDKKVAALEWAIGLIKEVQKTRKRTFAARWQQATDELRKHKEIINNMSIIPEEPPETSKEEKWN